MLIVVVNKVILRQSLTLWWFTKLKSPPNDLALGCIAPITTQHL